MPDPSPARRSARSSLVALATLLIVTAALRTGVVLARWEQLSPDPDAYRLIAENLAQHGVFSRTLPGEPVQPTAFRPPLYPRLLAATAQNGQVTATSVAVIHVLTGVLTVALVWLLGRRCGLDALSWLAGLLVAADPILLNQSCVVMTETLATLLTVLGWLALDQWSRRPSYWSAVLAGAILGLAVLCRPTFLIWTGMCGVYMVATGRSWKHFAHAVVLAVTLLLVLSPWVVRNWRTFGRLVATTSHGGYTLLLGNNPSFYEHLRGGDGSAVWDARQIQPLLDDVAASESTSPPLQREFESDRRFYDIARETIRQQPGTFLYASLLRIGSLWSPLAHRLDAHESRAIRWLRWLAGGWYVVLYVFAIVGAIRLRRAWLQTPWAWGLLCVLALMLVHSVYWTNLRMRAPLIPLVALVAVRGMGECRAKR
jgi:4-amino-4-deoxy-L-arabinose transferase-like glycosyltransferase